MASYQIICEGELSQGAGGEIICSGTLSTVPYSPILADLTFSQVGELAGATMLLFLMAFLFRFVFDNIRNR